MSPRPYPLIDDEGDLSSNGSTCEDDKDAESTFSTSNASGTGHGGALSESSNSDLRDKLIKNEEKAVRKTRIAVAVILLICAASVSTGVYLFASKNESKKYISEFGIHAESILNTVKWHCQFNFALMQQVSAAMTSSVMMMNASFPFYTHPTFEVPAGYADGMGGIMSVVYSPRIKSAQRAQWEKYSVENQDWLQESEYLRLVHPGHRDAVHGTIQDHEHDRRRRLDEEVVFPNISSQIWHWENTTKVVDTKEQDEDYYPIWQTTPPDATPVNSNLLGDPATKELFEKMLANNMSVLTGYTQINQLWDWMFDPEEKVQETNPHMYLMEPVYDTFSTNPKLAGVLTGLVSWSNILNRLLAPGENGIVVVIKDTCGLDFTYVLDGQVANFLGVGDLHDTEWDSMGKSSQLELVAAVAEDMCVHHLHIYPTDVFRSKYVTVQPIIFTLVVACSFLVTAAIFVLYDHNVNKRQNKTMDNAIRSNQVVASLFPANVRDRLMEDAEHQLKADKNGKLSGFNRKDIVDSQTISVSRPIADFFPHVTVLFADIAGFTAWSSTREPFQVFQLLETIYGALDEIAKRRRVFKVETVGDCYVAVAGMPDARKDHAVVMARFARDAIFKMNQYSHKLETTLGPDTGDLSFRCGLHSGPVTAGVLRGQNARFQLFGDTMNTAARVESTGMPGRIQISKATAELLTAAGKNHWFKPRDERVHAKGKGEMETFWLLLNAESVGSSAGSSSVGQMEENRFDQLHEVAERLPEQHPSDLNTKDRRLIEWNMSVVSQRVKAIAAQRDGVKVEDVDIPNHVATLLEQYVAGVASMYRDNAFHNFEHASHVTMSVTKMLSRIVGGEKDCGTKDEHCYTRDITSDPLSQLATVFSALIHDADHQGVPNCQLIKENQAVAQMYDNKSIAENNSIAVAWQYFMLDDFEPLRAFICPSAEEETRFKELITVCVQATDIADKELAADRNSRWKKVFSAENSDSTEQNSLKAQIVLEHLIQASDICHTMQHWHIYMKWNERLFKEMYTAFLEGRSEKNPSEFWYEGEIGFFDFYIIPLAQKLYECGVFGVSSDEFLNYARHNRQEWELKGRQVVAQYVEKYCKPEHVAAAKLTLATEEAVAAAVESTPSGLLFL